ncbi:Protein of uncharacterised function (DUF2938) [Dermatophilus congolensis]|uniref:Protein of uncharacterized function (DUF2938) n=1 Tax=Dermatophilus congolensis TaxID=1863 RepID=A0AA46BNB5_9MICO|nr:DUF2938 domain-containing protein [Dermatophilus congolensis]STD09806.1 Protein of uncharacterised function (DUF2938) [Dermatophilus congolensis]
MHLNAGKLVQAAVVGVGATLVMDGVAEVLRRTRGTRSLDYAIVGRWIGHMPDGVFKHDAIFAAEPVRHEKELGWAAHYTIGTGFAVAFAVATPEWLNRPRFFPAVAWGLGTLAAPWFLMQPCFGMGVAASKTPNPTQARLGSIRAHSAYGAGLWLSGLLVHGIVSRNS